MSFKHTFEYNGEEKTITVPDEVVTQGRKENLTLHEIIERYLSDEGYIVDETVAELTDKAKANGMNTAGRIKGEGQKKRKAPTRKPDETKRMLIAALENCISTLGNTENVEVTNIERIVAFSIGEDKYEITLSKKRKPKK